MSSLFSGYADMVITCLFSIGLVAEIALVKIWTRFRILLGYQHGFLMCFFAQEVGFLLGADVAYRTTFFAKRALTQRGSSANVAFA